MKKQRLAYMALGAVIAIAGMIAATAFNIGAQSGSQGDVTVRSLTVEDSLGNRLLKIGVGELGGGQITVYGVKDTPLVEIGVYAAGGLVRINDHEGRRCVAAYHDLLERAGVVEIFKSDVSTIMPKVEMRAEKTGGVVRVRGAKGITPDAMMYVNDVGGFIGNANTGVPEPKAFMTADKDGGSVMILSNADARGAGLTINKGVPIVGTWDKFGKQLTQTLPVPGR